MSNHAVQVSPIKTTLLPAKVVSASPFSNLHYFPRGIVLDANMHVRTQLITLLPLSLTSAFMPADTSGTDGLAKVALENVRWRLSDPPVGLAGALLDGIIKHFRTALYGRFPGEVTHPDQISPSCTLASASVRKEWDTLPHGEKRAYIDAVLCLTSKPALSGDEIPGARSRFDDFFGVHINQTLSIHGTVSRSAELLQGR